MKIKTVIVDDELNNVEALTALLSFIPEVLVTGRFTRPEEAVEFVNQQAPDLLFLDVEMPGLSGFDLLDRIAVNRPEIVFVTAHGEAAVQAFRIHATDFLVKPVIFAELKQTIERIADRINARRHAAIDRLSLVSQSGADIVEVSGITHLAGTGSYTDVFLSDGRKITVSKNLGEFETLPAMQLFLRLHTSYLVNPAYMQKYLKEDGGSVVLKNGTVIPVSRRKKDELLQWIRSLQGD